MTVSTWDGMVLADIPAKYFDEPFETWTGKLPALVLASTRPVPVSTHGQWRTPGGYLPGGCVAAGYPSGNGGRGQRDCQFFFY